MKAKKLGEIVKRLRVAYGITRADLGDATKLSFGTIRYIEWGRHWPSWETLDKLCSHPSMRDLIKTCVHDGVELDVRPPPKPQA